MGFKTCTNKMSVDTTVVSGVEFTRQNFQPSVTTLENSLTINHINELINQNKLPSDCKTLIPGEPVRSDYISPGLICFHLVAFEYGLSFPFPQLILDFFSTFKLSPAQIMPGLWRLLLSIDAIGKESGVSLGVEEVFTQYDLRVGEPGRYTIRIRPKCEHLVFGSNEVCDRLWKSKYFFVEKDSLGDLGVVLESNWPDPDLYSRDLKKRPETDQLIKDFLNLPVAKRQLVTGKKTASKKCPKPENRKPETSTSTMEKSSSRIVTRGSLKSLRIGNMVKQAKTKPSASCETKSKIETLLTTQLFKKQNIGADDDVVILGNKMWEVNSSLKKCRTNSAMDFYNGKSGSQVLSSTGVYTLQALHSLAVLQERLDSLETEVINLRGDKIESDTIRLNYKTALESIAELEKNAKLYLGEIDKLKTEVAESQMILDKYEKEAKETAQYYGRIGRLEILLEHNKAQYTEEMKDFKKMFLEDTYFEEQDEVVNAAETKQADASKAVVDAFTDVGTSTDGNTVAQVASQGFVTAPV